MSQIQVYLQEKFNFDRFYGVYAVILCSLLSLLAIFSGEFLLFIVIQIAVVFGFYAFNIKYTYGSELDREKFFTTILCFLTIVVSLYGTGRTALAGELLLAVAYYGILAMSLNISTGHVGVVNFGVIAQVAVGAIIFGLSTLNFGASIFLGIIYGMIGAAIFSAILASSTLRLREDYFAIVSVVTGEIIKQMLRTEPTLRAPKDPTTGGYTSFPGIINVPKPFTGSYDNAVAGTLIENMPYRFFLGLFCCGLLALVFLFAQLLTYSPYGRVLRSIREDDLSTSTYGKDLFRYQVGIFAISGAVAGIGGAILAWQLGGIYPEQLTPVDTFFAWAIIIIGGRGNNKGTIVGTIAFVMVRRMSLFLNDADIFNRFYINDGVHAVAPWAPDVSMGYVQLIFVGVLMLVFLRKFPQGLIAEEAFRPEIRGLKLPPPGSQADTVGHEEENLEKSSKMTEEVTK